MLIYQTENDSSSKNTGSTTDSLEVPMYKINKEPKQDVPGF